MKKRIFIAANLPEKIKKKLILWQGKYDFLPVRWTKENSLRLTLVFIGYADDDQVVAAARAMRKTAQNGAPFNIKFKKIIYGPPEKSAKIPRMIWLSGEPNQQLADLKHNLEDSLLSVNSGFNKPETKKFIPHITLARTKMERWRDLENPPLIDEIFEAEAPVESIELVQSNLARDGAQYAVLESAELLSY